MLIVGLIVFLVILGMFMQAMTLPPSSDSEWQNDTDDELTTTSASADTESHPVAA